MGGPTGIFQMSKLEELRKIVTRSLRKSVLQYKIFKYFFKPKVPERTIVFGIPYEWFQNIKMGRVTAIVMDRKWDETALGLYMEFRCGDNVEYRSFETQYPLSIVFHLTLICRIYREKNYMFSETELTTRVGYPNSDSLAQAVGEPFSGWIVCFKEI